ncbi:MAG: hypothetical protein KGJ99_11460 [Betaproteobacteria bacterium]|nr:hypothetical protein [Betaproteobacteria bacterium]
MDSFTHLLVGHDTVECAYYLHDLSAGAGIGLEALHVAKEAARQDRKRHPRLITLGGVEFYLFGHGSSSGYPFRFENADYSVGYGELNMPSFFVKFRSEALWREGALALHQRFVTWAEAVGFHALRPETLSRVDFTFDYQIPAANFDADSVVSLSAKDATFRKDRREQTIQYGAGGDVMLRIYNKIAEINDSSSKFWFRALWNGVFEDVWRIEWQVRKAMLKRFAIRSFQDLLDQQGDLLTYLAEEHDTLRIKADDANRSRWPVHPVWLDLRQRIQAFNREGVYRSFDQTAAVEERLWRAAIAVYGYLKHIGALQARCHLSA